MKVKKMNVESYPLSLDNPKAVMNITYLWCNDGWCYVPELKQRRKYVLENLNVIDVAIEPYTGVIPLFQNSEKVCLTVFHWKGEQIAKVWSEKTDFSCDLFVEIDSTQSKNKKLRGHQLVQ